MKRKSISDIQSVENVSD